MWLNKAIKQKKKKKKQRLDLMYVMLWNSNSDYRHYNWLLERNTPYSLQDELDVYEHNVFYHNTTSLFS